MWLHLQRNYMKAVKSQNKQFGDDVQFVKISEKDAKSQIRDEKIDERICD